MKIYAVKQANGKYYVRTRGRGWSSSSDTIEGASVWSTKRGASTARTYAGKGAEVVEVADTEDTARLNHLQFVGRLHVCRDSTRGNGYRLHNATPNVTGWQEAVPCVREAIDSYRGVTTN